MVPVSIFAIDWAATRRLLDALDDPTALDAQLFAAAPIASLGEDTLSALNHDPGGLAVHVFATACTAGLELELDQGLEVLVGDEPHLEPWLEGPELVFEEFHRVVVLPRTELEAIANGPGAGPVVERIRAVAGRPGASVAIVEGDLPGLHRVVPPAGVPMTALWDALRKVDELPFDGVRFLRGEPAAGELPQRDDSEQGERPAVIWRVATPDVEAFALADGTAWMLRADPLLRRAARWLSGARERFEPARPGVRPTADAALLAASTWRSLSTPTSR